MKPKLSIGVSVLIALALVCFGLLFGTWSGFSGDREQVNALLAGEEGIHSVLSYRAADGLNLCVVARRHLSSDTDVDALEKAATAVKQGGSIDEMRAADANLETAMRAVTAKLPQASGFQDSQRDQAYLNMLTDDFEQLGRSSVFTAYNEAVTEFNSQLQGTGGWLARQLGILPAKLYPISHSSN